MDQLPLALQISAPPQRRGRPPGAKSKRSLDLAKYIEATFAGATPGQQSAQLCMVTPKDLKNARALAKEMQIIDIDLEPLILAMVVKAAQLARALGIGRADAWLLLQKERADLMPYVHQRQAQKAADADQAPPATVFIMEGAEARDLVQANTENVEEFPAQPE